MKNESKLIFPDLDVGQGCM